MLPQDLLTSFAIAMLPKNIVAWLAFAGPASTAAAASLPLRFVTFNIRGASTNPVEGEERWDVRRPLVSGTLNQAADGAEGPTLIGLQEVWHKQLVDIKGDLGGWSHVGVGRDDGNEGGDYSPILYDGNVLDLVWNETKWLSETPDEPSYGWGASNRRTYSIAVLEHKETEERFIAANTHLDHEIPEARVNGLRIIIDRLRATREEYGDLAIGFTGDFNSEAGEDAHKEMESEGYLRDLYEVATEHIGPDETFTGFVDSDRKKRIDYIYFGPEDAGWEVGPYEVKENKIDGVLASDHRAVIGDLTLQY